MQRARNVLMNALKAMATVLASGGCATVAMAQPGGGASLPVQAGEVVHTHSANNQLQTGPNQILDLDDPVVQLLDVRNPAGQGAVPNVTWNPPRFWNAGAGANEWTARNLGLVFGVTLDNATSPNIYVTAHDYEFEAAFSGGNSSFPTPGGNGAVWRLDGVTGAICLIAQLPNTGPKLGQVAWGSRGNSLYISNFEDGRIYRVTPPAACPAVPIKPFGPSGPDIFDHGTGLSTPIADDLQAGITALGRRVFAVCVNEAESRLYYGVWIEDYLNVNAAQNNEIWSVPINAAGQFAGAAQLEAAMPNLVINNTAYAYTAPPADITFGPNGNMYAGERSGNAHDSRVIEFAGGSGAWSPAPSNKWRIGNLNDGVNSAGGVGVDCEGNVWSTGYQLHLPIDSVFGLQRVNVGGNAADPTTTTNSYLVDTDNAPNQFDKFDIGSLELFRVCESCARITEETIVCKPPSTTGQPCWTYTFTLTNISGQTITQINFASPLVSPNPLVLGAPLANNQSTTITLTICGGVPGSSIDLPIILFNQEGQACCNVRKRVTLPDCRCFQLEGGLPPQVQCTGPGTFNVNMFIQPTEYAIGHVFIAATGLGLGQFAIVTPSYTPVAIPQWGFGNVPFSVNTNVPPGTQLCFTVVVHTPDFTECCSRDICIRVPDCRPGQEPCDLDFNNDGVFPDDQDVIDFMNVLAGGVCSTPMCDTIDFNGNGVFPEEQDVIDFFNVLAGGPCP